MPGKDLDYIPLTVDELSIVMAFNGSMQETAAMVGISRHQLYRRLRDNEKLQYALSLRHKMCMDPEIKVRIDPDRLMIADREERQRFWTNLMRDTDQDPYVRLRASENLAKVDGDFTYKVKYESSLEKQLPPDLVELLEDIAKRGKKRLEEADSKALNIERGADGVYRLPGPNGGS